MAPHFLGRERVFRLQLSRLSAFLYCCVSDALGASAETQGWASRSRGAQLAARAAAAVTCQPHTSSLLPFVKSATARVGPLTLLRGRQPPHGSMSRALASSFLQASRAGPTRSMSSLGGLVRAREAARTCVPASRRGAQPSRRARRAPCSRRAAVLFLRYFSALPLTCWQRLLQSVLSHAPSSVRVDAQCRSLVVMLCKMMCFPQCQRLQCRK